MRRIGIDVNNVALKLAFGAIALLSLLAATPVAMAQDQSQAELWTGAIEIPTGEELEVIIHVVNGPDGQTGTWDIPAQGVQGMALEAVSFGETAHFEISQLGVTFDGDLLDDGTIDGIFDQGGMQMNLRLRRMEPAELGDVGPKRPQTPKAPFPYESREVTYTNPNDGVTLAGTLVIPEGEGPFPAVMFITGSGPQDRDETLFGHKPFLLISDALARHGIASLRADDRGEGSSEGVLFETPIETLAEDAMAGVKLLAQTPEINAGRIGIIGHSEGGTIAPLVASQSDDVDFIVLIAGTGIDGRSLMSIQLRAVMGGLGVPDAFIDPQIEAQKALFAAITSDATDEEIREEIRTLVTMQFGGQGDEAAINRVVDQQSEMLMSDWFRSFLLFDPRPALERVRVPVLAVNGSVDLQVPPDPNLVEIEAALDRAGNDDVTIIEFEGLNHLMQESDTGSITEYNQIEQTMAPAVLETIVLWIEDHTGA